MADRDLERMDEQDFDALLMDALPDLPASEVVHRVTSWRTAMNRILVGLCLISVTLQFWNLQYILPMIGWLLILLGFRTMRRENKWFRGCFSIAGGWVAYQMVHLVLRTMVLGGEILHSKAFQPLYYGMLLLQIALYALFWLGLREIRGKTGLDIPIRSAAMLPVWYALLVWFGLRNLGGVLVVILMLVIYGLIIRGLCRLASALDQAGYAIESASVRLSDRALTTLLAAVLAVGMGCGYFFGSQYPMDWTERVPTEHSQVFAVKRDLLELGFPADVLDDLTDQEILAMTGAKRVVMGSNEIPLNDGRVVQIHQGSGVQEDAVHAVEELKFTGVAVLLPGEPERWQLIHHFRWQANPDYWGTESMQLWSVDKMAARSGWRDDGAVTGRVLVERDGTTYTAPFYALGPKRYTSNTIFWGAQASTDVFAEFSLPKDGKNGRAYLTYPIIQLQEGCIIDSWVHYTHQMSHGLFPVATAAEHRMGSGWSIDSVFRTTIGAVQFYPFRDGAYLFGSDQEKNGA